MISRYREKALLYKQTLLEHVIPFWEQHSIDQDHGGYFTCLDRQGNIYDKDKFTWLQARQAWTFSMLFNKVEARAGWLEIAKSGIGFLIDHALSEQGDFYFSTTAAGLPLVKPYNIFSDCFAAMAFSQYAKATKDQEVSDLALNTFHNILARKHNAKGVFNKRTDNRPLKDFALPMILSNLVLEMEDLLTSDEVSNIVDFAVQEVMQVFTDVDRGLIHEYVSTDGHFIDCFEGRLINPGHGLEAMWFILDIGARRNDQMLVDLVVERIILILEFGWDQEFGGIFYFLDAAGHPPQQLEWDQKLWWVHLEALVALTKAMQFTDDPKIWQWYKRVHEYTWSKFPDPQYGEWFGYLNRQGQPHLDLKGGKWKGCFHLPRALYQCWQTFEQLAGSVKTVD
jgi:N-acylglucosamine 2-epimerase